MNWIHLSFHERVAVLFKNGMSRKQIAKTYRCKLEKIDRILREAVRGG